MRTIEYKLEGKEVPSNLRGQVIRLRVPETYAEAEGLTEKGESDVVAKFADGLVIATQGALQTKSKKNVLTTLQKWADEYKYTVRAEGTGTRKEVKPETQAARAAKNSGNRLFEKCRDDAAFLARMVKLGVVDEGEFQTWLSTQAAPAAQA